MRAVGRVREDVRQRCVGDGARRAKRRWGPGNKRQLPQVEANAAALGKLFQPGLGGYTFGEHASDECVEKMMRYAGSFESGHGFKRPPSRMCQKGPGATVCLPDTPSRCASSAWMRRKIFQDEWMARSLLAQSFRTCGLFPGAPESRENLYGSSAFLFATRERALLQMLVSLSLSPTVSLEDKVMVTDALASPLAVRQKQMIKGSATSDPYETPQMFGPREYSPVAGNVLATLEFAAIVNVKDGRASKLRPRLGGAGPDTGGSHFVFRRTVLLGRVATMPLTCVRKRAMTYVKIYAPGR